VSFFLMIFATKNFYVFLHRLFITWRWLVSINPIVCLLIFSSSGVLWIANRWYFSSLQSFFHLWIGFWSQNLLLFVHLMYARIYVPPISLSLSLLEHFVNVSVCPISVRVQWQYCVPVLEYCVQQINPMELVKKFPTFYGAHSFITGFKVVHKNTNTKTHRCVC
jgi:hypothetical protein